MMIINQKMANLISEGDILIQKYGTTDYMSWALIDIIRLHEIVNELHALGYPTRRDSDKCSADQQR